MEWNWRRGHRSVAWCWACTKPSPDIKMKTKMSMEDFQSGINRRTFLGRAAYGLGGLAFASLLDPSLLRGAEPPNPSERWKGIIHTPHFPVRAKRIIHLYMAGGPSHLESFDFKPKLKE